MAVFRITTTWLCEIKWAVRCKSEGIEISADLSAEFSAEIFKANGPIYSAIGAVNWCICQVNWPIPSDVSAQEFYSELISQSHMETFVSAFGVLPNTHHDKIM